MFNGSFSVKNSKYGKSILRGSVSKESPQHRREPIALSANNSDNSDEMTVHGFWEEAAFLKKKIIRAKNREL